MEQLASLANVKAWLGDTASTGADDQLTRLIQQASRFILNYIQWSSMFKNAVVEIKDGLGNNSTILNQWPVISLEQLIVGVQTIAACPALPVLAPGYVLEPWDGFPPGSPQALQLNGYWFPPGFGNVQINYTTGFFITNEAHTTAAAATSSDPVTVNVDAPSGNWGRDDGVTLADGTPLTLVTGTPCDMEYTAVAGLYTFNYLQADEAVLISYSYIPPDIEEACIEIVGERYRYSKRIGQQSVSAAGQVTTSFSLKSLQDYVRDTLDRYKRSFHAC